MKKLLSIVLSAALFFAVSSCAHEEVSPTIDKSENTEGDIMQPTVS